jgi:hypothetical protein
MKRGMNSQPKGLNFCSRGYGHWSPDLFENGLDADGHIPYHTSCQSYNTIKLVISVVLCQ